MSVEVRLTAEQMPLYKQVLDKAKVSYASRGSLIELTKDSFPVILAALKAAHLKALVIKTKTAANMERLFGLQEIVGIVQNQACYFETEEVAAANDETLPLPEAA